MEKETVLEIEFIPVWDKWVWKITKQNEEILKKGEFIDEDIKVKSSFRPEFDIDKDILYIRGEDELNDSSINFCILEEKVLIERKVKAINEKYGIKKRWRADYENLYYYTVNFSDVFERTELYYYQDNIRYKYGNYFKTKQEAEEYAEYMRKKSLEWHEKRGENE